MLTCRKAEPEDVLLYFEWANDEEVRKQSFTSKKITLEEHTPWFLNKIKDDECLMLLFENEDQQPVGQVRFQKEKVDTYLVGISVNSLFRGMGLATKLLVKASEYFFEHFPGSTINAYIKEGNSGSVKSFVNAGFLFDRNLILDGVKSVLFIKEHTDADRK